MIVRINGEEVLVDRESPTVADLLESCSVDSPELVSVQVNGRFLPGARYAATPINDGDEVDFLYFLGGGR